MNHRIILLIILGLLIGFAFGYVFSTVRFSGLVCLPQEDFEEVSRFYEIGKLLGW